MATRTPTYYTGTITGQNGTLITVLDAILVTGEGWTKTYSGTNKAVYTQASGNGFCLRVQDDGPGGGAAREAIVRGAESASDVDTLIDPFPTVAQVSDANCVWRKSNSADSTTRNYYCVADGNSFHLIVNFNGTSDIEIYSYFDTEPFYTGDGYNTAITTRNSANNSANGYCTNNNYPTLHGATFTNNMFFARSADGLVKSDCGNWAGSVTSVGRTGYNHPSYPNTATNKLHMGFLCARSAYSNTSSAGLAGEMYRGVVPLLLEPLLGNGSGILAEGDTFKASAYDNTDNSLELRMVSTAPLSTSRRVILQKAGTWDPGF